MSLPSVVVPDDATLARGLAAGDSRALAAVYDRYAGRLLAFCQSIVRDDGDAQSCLKATFTAAATGLAQVSPPPVLRAWLFAVARAECRRVLDVRVALVLDPEGDPAANPADTEPVSVFEPLEPSEDTIDLFTPIPAFSAGATIGLLLDPVDSTAIAVGDNGAAGAGGAGNIARSAGPASAANSANPIDETSYANHLVLELAERQQLPPAEVGLAIGVATASAHAALSRARRADRSARGGLLGPGRIFAPEMAAIRASVLTAAEAAPVAASAGWPGGWPPSDPAFDVVPLAARRRRWGAPLAALAVLLLALGAIFGLLATTGGGHRPSARSAATAGSSLTSTSSAALPTGSSTSSAADPTGSGPGGPLAVAPPTPSQPTTAVTTPVAPTSSATLTLVVTTDKQPVTIRAGTTGSVCAAKKSCSLLAPTGTIVSITDALRSGPGPSVRLDTFSAPASCAQTPGVCIFVLTSNLSIKLTTPAR